eukprot:12191836-Alexandrium_andersonii.AAC.1
MSASLVGSEMCIRDRFRTGRSSAAAPLIARANKPGRPVEAKPPSGEGLASTWLCGSFGPGKLAARVLGLRLVHRLAG